MRRNIEAGRCLCVRDIGTEVSAGVFKLRGFVDDMDYCDTVHEAWIWSIGRKKDTGEIFAATNSQFYLNDEYECLWLR